MFVGGGGGAAPPPPSPAPGVGPPIAPKSHQRCATERERRFTYVGQTFGPLAAHVMPRPRSPCLQKAKGRARFSDDTAALPPNAVLHHNAVFGDRLPRYVHFFSILQMGSREYQKGGLHVVGLQCPH